MRVLVTGATSLLGRHTVARLLDAGHDVVVLQRTPCGLDGVVEHLGSVTDADVVDTAMAGVNGVIHLAAKVDPVGDWADFEAINIEGTATVHAAAALRACRGSCTSRARRSPMTVRRSVATVLRRPTRSGPMATTRCQSDGGAGSACGL